MHAATQDFRTKILFVIYDAQFSSPVNFHYMYRA